MSFQLDNLAQLAEDLKNLGVEATHDFVYGLHTFLEGLDVGDEFFPLWELSLPENAEDLERGDFDAIKARRGPDWCVEPHRVMKAT